MSIAPTPEPHYSDSTITLHHGDCLDVLRSLPDASVDSVVTDPPYGLEFMGKGWDAPWRESDVNADAGFHGGGIGETRGLPSFTGSTNPKCLRCKGTRRGRRDGTAKVAVCLCEDGGHFPNVRAVEMRAFAEWCETWVSECYRILKPGGHLLSFGGTRTWHRLTCAVEDAGFEVRDSIAWLYGSGFPKSLDVSKAIDKRRDWSLVGKLADAIRAARAESGLSLREVGEAVKVASGGAHGEWYHRGGHMFFETGMSLPGRAEWKHLRSVLPIPAEFDAMYEEAERAVLQERTMTQGGGTSLQLRMGEVREVRADITAPATPDAERWQGWGTALKPAFEPVVVARKPLSGTVAANVLAHGTGALNIDGCRVGDGSGSRERGDEASRETRYTEKGGTNFAALPGVRGGSPAGRWPGNVVLDESQAEALDEQAGELKSGANPTRRGSDKFRDAYGDFAGQEECVAHRGADSGGASRFFYVAKADASERVRVDGIAHPTVKPLSLMRWLVRLVTPPGGTVLEPFAGSGTTVEACLLEGFRCVAIEREADYLPLIRQRIHRRRDPVEAVKSAGEDAGLFDLLDGGAA